MSRISSDHPLHVVLGSTQKGWGGGETYLFALANGLYSRGHRVSVVAPPASSLAKRVETSSQKFDLLETNCSSPLEMWRIRRWLAKNESLILHCNDSKSLTRMGLSAIKIGSVQVVSMRHTMFPIRSPSKYQRLSQRVICVSHAVADACIERGLSPNWVRVIHAATDCPMIDTDRVSRLRRQLLGDSDEKLIVAVGNLLPCKGHSTLVRAAAILRNQGINVQTVIAGEGNERANLEDLIDSLKLRGQVRLLGFRDDADELLAAADVVAHPAHAEGLCLTVATSMMLGKPVVSTAVGGLCDVLGIDERMQAGGPFASIVSPDDADSLAQRIGYQLTAPADTALLAEARSFALDRFTTGRMVDETILLYREITKQKAVA